MKRTTRYEIRSERQLKALVLPLRAEIVELVASLGPMSASDIAELLGRRRPAIHYQLNKLTEVGLLRPAGSRGEGREAQALYATPGRPMGVVFQPEKPRAVELIAGYASSLLKRSRRVLSQALRRPDAVTSGKRRNTHAAQFTCRLDRAQLAELNAHLDAIRRLCAPSKQKSAGALHLVTLTLAPLDTPAGRNPDSDKP